MPNEMIRPCTLPAKLKNVGILTLLGEEKTDSYDPVVFDAFRFDWLKFERSTSYALEEHYLVKIYLTNPHSVILRYFPEAGIEALIRQTVYLVNEALNAHVKATKEVLDAMEKVPEAKFSASGDYDCIQANCPLALEVLLQFYTDGTPVKGKETE